MTSKNELFELVNRWWDLDHERIEWDEWENCWKIECTPVHVRIVAWGYMPVLLQRVQYALQVAIREKGWIYKQSGTPKVRSAYVKDPYNPLINGFASLEDDTADVEVLLKAFLEALEAEAVYV